MIGPSAVSVGYPTKPLGEVVEFLDHLRKPITASDREPGPFPYYGANGQQDSIADWLFDEPLVLLAEDGGHFDAPERGIAYRIEGKSWVNNHAHVLRAIGELDSRWLTRVLENYDVTQFLTGSTRAKLTKAGASRIPIPIPPIAEQRRIAAILDAADALRAKRRQAIVKLDTLTQAMFIDMFGDPLANERGWKRLAFEELCPSHLGKMLDQKQQTGMHVRPYLRNTNVRWFGFDLAELAAMDFDSVARKKYRLVDGDVLICEGGEPGRAAIWRGEIEECYFQKALHRGRPNPDLATPEFIVHLLKRLADRGGLVDHISTATIAHLTGKRLKTMQVIAPPIDLQQSFAIRAVAAEEQRDAVTASAADFDLLFSAIQQRAFRGDL